MQENLDCYLVGGAVRDEMLGREVHDRDWVVVGSTPKQMRRRGFLKVGRDFPVFLHPRTHEEYALARTERKQGEGHTGFTVTADPSVTLEDDLKRRDLTINAMARTPEGELVDPYAGARDLQERRLRHVSDAFVEDPLRVFRVARFAAQLPGFQVAPDTAKLMCEMVARGELRTLSAERVWQELEKALEAPDPEGFFRVLTDCGGLADWLSEMDGEDHRFGPGSSVERFADLQLTLPQAAALGERLRIPKRYLQAARLRLLYGDTLQRWRTIGAKALAEGFVGLQVMHGSERLDWLVGYLQARGASDLEPLHDLAEGFNEVEPADADNLAGKAYGRALKQARIAWLENYLGR